VIDGDAAMVMVSPLFAAVPHEHAEESDAGEGVHALDEEEVGCA